MLACLFLLACLFKQHHLAQAVCYRQSTIALVPSMSRDDACMHLMRGFEFEAHLSLSLRLLGLCVWALTGTWVWC